MCKREREREECVQERVLCVQERVLCDALDHFSGNFNQEIISIMQNLSPRLEIQQQAPLLYIYIYKRDIYIYIHIFNKHKTCLLILSSFLIKMILYYSFANKSLHLT